MQRLRSFALTLVRFFADSVIVKAMAGILTFLAVGGLAAPYFFGDHEKAKAFDVLGRQFIRINGIEKGNFEGHDVTFVREFLNAEGDLFTNFTDYNIASVEVFSRSAAELLADRNSSFQELANALDSGDIWPRHGSSEVCAEAVRTIHLQQDLYSLLATMSETPDSDLRRISQTNLDGPTHSGAFAWGGESAYSLGFSDQFFPPEGDVLFALPVENAALVFHACGGTHRRQPHLSMFDLFLTEG